MLVLLLQFVIRGCLAITATTTNAEEDLGHFSRDPKLMCPGQIIWPQVPAPISCDDPACRGISWAVPPYRCRQRDGIMFGIEVFGCPCCPRLADFDDPRCAGSPDAEICRSELLRNCVCVSSNRRATTAPIDTSALPSAAAAAQEEDALADLSISESLNNDIRAITPSSGNCLRNSPVRCLDHQCRGSDDWKNEMSSTPRCNRADGKLVIDNIEIALHGCPCCPEYIACSSTECNGGTNQACTSVPLHGCFCDWPGRGPVLTTPFPMDDEPDVYINHLDACFDDPNFRPSGGPVVFTTAVSFTASSRIFYQARPIATQRGIAPALPQNLTQMDLLSRRQEALSVSPNGSMFVMPDHFKHGKIN